MAAPGLALAVVALEGLFTTAAAPVILQGNTNSRAIGALFALPAVAAVGGIATMTRLANAGVRPLREASVVLACGLVAMAAAPNVPVLVAGRVIVGIAGAMVGAGLYSAVAVDADGAHRSRLVRMIGVAVSLPAVFVPGLGVLVDALGPAPAFGAMAFAAAALATHTPRTRWPKRFDERLSPMRSKGLAGMSGCLGAGTLALWAAPSLEPAAGGVVLTAGVLAVGGGVALEVERSTSVVGERLPSVAARGLAMALFFGVDILVPLHMASKLDVPTTVAGAAVVSSALGWAGSSALFPRFRLRARAAVAVGALGLLCTVVCVSVIVSVAETRGALIPGLVVVWFFAGAATAIVANASTELVATGQDGRLGGSGSTLLLVDAGGIAAGTAIAGYLIAQVGIVPTTLFLAIFAGTPMCIAAIALEPRLEEVAQ